MRLPRIETADDVWAVLFVIALGWMFVSWVTTWDWNLVGLIAVAIALIIGALAAWPLSILFAVIGGFIGGGGGAMVGAAIAGAVGVLFLLLVILRSRL